MKSLKPCCALCPARFIARRTSSSICKARDKLQDNRWGIMHAFVVWWQVSYVVKAAGDCSVPNTLMTRLFVPVSVSYREMKQTQILYFIAFCIGKACVDLPTILCENGFHHKGRCLKVNFRDIHHLILSTTSLQDILQYPYCWTTCKSTCICR